MTNPAQIRFFTDLWSPGKDIFSPAVSLAVHETVSQFSYTIHRLEEKSRNDFQKWGRRGGSWSRLSRADYFVYEMCRFIHLAGSTPRCLRRVRIENVFVSGSETPPVRSSVIIAQLAVWIAIFILFLTLLFASRGKYKKKSIFSSHSKNKNPCRSHLAEIDSQLIFNVISLTLLFATRGQRKNVELQLVFEERSDPETHTIRIRKTT